VVDHTWADAAGNDTSDHTRDEPSDRARKRPLMITPHPSRSVRPRVAALTAVAALALTAVAALALTACTSAADEAVAGVEPVLSFSVVGTDTLAFEPAAYAVIAGNAIELQLRSEDAVEHDFIVAGAGPFGSAFDQSGGHSHDEEEFAEDLHIAHAMAGEEAVSLFTISEPGVYEVYCSIPGHREAGMVGQLAVVDPGDARHDRQGVAVAAARRH
jgi:uncharacterized cupredoxin-like copper-binding protein